MMRECTCDELQQQAQNRREQGASKAQARRKHDAEKAQKKAPNEPQRMPPCANNGVGGGGGESNGYAILSLVFCPHLSLRESISTLPYFHCLCHLVCLERLVGLFAARHVGWRERAHRLNDCSVPRPLRVGVLDRRHVDDAESGDSLRVEKGRSHHSLGGKNRPERIGREELDAKNRAGRIGREESGGKNRASATCGERRQNVCQMCQTGPLTLPPRECPTRTACSTLASSSIRTKSSAMSTTPKESSHGLLPWLRRSGR